MAQYEAHLFPGNEITLTASATIVGGQLVEITGNMTVGPAGANSTACVGVATNDAATGDLVRVLTTGVHDLTASGAIAAGAQVICGAAGVAVTVGAATAEKIVGTALEAISNGLTGRVALRKL